MREQATSSVEFRSRPVVYDYGSACQFLNELYTFYKSKGSFSLRQRTAKVGLCSQALVSQILKGKRQLNRDNLPAIAAVFKLTSLELEYLDSQLISVRGMEYKEVKSQRRPKNHLLSDWLHPYVKDVINLKGFSLDAEIIHFMLQGLAPAKRIKKSIEFLMQEGFWRRSIKGTIEQEDPAVISTNGIPNEKIRSFHKKALEIAHRGVTNFPMNQRKASTVLIAVNEDKMDELRGMVDAFQKSLLEFIEKNPHGKDSLVQITTHLTPVGRSK